MVASRPRASSNLTSRSERSGEEDQRSIRGQYFLDATAFLPKATAGVIDENAPHQHRGNSEEIGAALPVCSLLANESQIGLVNEGSGLKSMV
jgi:hypothetical protein